jgi:hypothetical protein
MVRGSHENRHNPVSQVFVGIAIGKVQQKSRKGIRKIESPFRPSSPAQKTVARSAERCAGMGRYVRCRT